MLTVKLHPHTAYQLPLVWRPIGDEPLQRISVCNTKSPHCFGCGIKEQILSKVGICIEIE